MDVIFNTPGIGGLVAFIVTGIFIVSYILVLRWVLKGEKVEPGNMNMEQETEKEEGR
ncbi:MAG: hypothetical protein JSV88_23180 [Candidatus Aminicenantes bacterium]|nr:MAG: hypothetical protein JSV88_23180 [Candidatus Aminicenantes bacterium]